MTDTPGAGRHLDLAYADVYNVYETINGIRLLIAQFGTEADALLFIKAAMP